MLGSDFILICTLTAIWKCNISQNRRESRVVILFSSGGFVKKGGTVYRFGIIVMIMCLVIAPLIVAHDAVVVLAVLLSMNLLWLAGFFQSAKRTASRAHLEQIYQTLGVLTGPWYATKYTYVQIKSQNHEATKPLRKEYAVWQSRRFRTV